MLDDWFSISLELSNVLSNLCEGFDTVAQRIVICGCQNIDAIRKVLVLLGGEKKRSIIG